MCCVRCSLWPSKLSCRLVAVSAGAASYSSPPAAAAWAAVILSVGSSVSHSVVPDQLSTGESITHKFLANTNSFLNKVLMTHTHRYLSMISTCCHSSVCLCYLQFNCYYLDFYCCVHIMCTVLSLVWIKKTVFCFISLEMADLGIVYYMIKVDPTIYIMHRC